MKLTSTSFEDGGPMPPACAFSYVTGDRRYVDAPNRNPALAWEDVPPGTRSLVVVSDDLDVPADLSGYGRADVEFDHRTPRRRLCHWVLIDVDPTGPPIAEGEFSDGVTRGGKPGPEAPRGTRQGVNEFSDHPWDEPGMVGRYFGYDGPRPPWNDRLPHRYEFALYALDLARLPVAGVFDRAAVLAAMDGHVLARAALTGISTGHPAP